VYVARGIEAAVAVPISAVEWLERSDGKELAIVGLGAIAGAVIGAIIGAKRSSGELDSVGSLIAAPIIGAVAGVAVGYALAPIRWTLIQLR
jgi:hypothetical protein